MKFKKGSHIGTVISFILFITFVVFIYVISSPSLESRGEEESLLNYLGNRIVENSSVNLTHYTISYRGEGDCIQVNLSGTIENNNVIVKNQKNQKINSEVIGDDVIIQKNSLSFFRIYYSNEEFNKNLWSSEECSAINSDYEKGLLRTEKKLSSEKIKDLKNLYDSDYEKLKKDFNFPDSNDFGFGFVFNNGSFIETEEDIQTDVFIKKTPIEYINNDANIVQGDLIVKVW